MSNKPSSQHSKFEPSDTNIIITNAINHYLRTIPIKDLDTLTKEYIEIGMKRFLISSYTRLDGLKVYTSLLSRGKYVNEKTLIDKIMLNKLAATSSNATRSGDKYTDITIVYENLYATIKSILKDK